jgi:hypothetical protein
VIKRTVRFYGIELLVVGDAGRIGNVVGVATLHADQVEVAPWLCTRRRLVRVLRNYKKSEFDRLKPAKTSQSPMPNEWQINFEKQRFVPPELSCATKRRRLE